MSDEKTPRWVKIIWTVARPFIVLIQALPLPASWKKKLDIY